MAKARKRFDPLARMSEQGLIGYVEEEIEGQVLQVSVEDILDSPFQTREEMDPDDEEEQAKFAQLVYSIKTRGIYPPIPVQRHPTLPGKYFLPAGGHGRRDAAKEAGLETVPVVIVEFSDDEVGLATAQENLARRNLTPIEEGRLYKRLMETFGWTQETLASKLGMKNRGRIKDCTALVDFAPDILAMVRKRKGNSGVRAAGYLHRLNDPRYALPPEEAARLRAPIIAKFLANDLTTEGVKIEVESVLAAVLTQREREQAQHSDSSASMGMPVTPAPASERLPENSQRPSSPPASSVSSAHPGLSTPVDAEVSSPVVLKQTKSASDPTAPGLSERAGQAQESLKRFQRYKRLIGNEKPSERERTILITLLEEIQEILNRA